MDTTSQTWKKYMWQLGVNIQSPADLNLLGNTQAIWKMGLFPRQR
jgi:hypothetical protein